MDNLRLILIIVGITIIAVIYLWDRIQTRRNKQRQEMRPILDPHDEPELVISGKNTSVNDLTAELADLNSFMAGARSDEEEDIEAESIVITRDASLRTGTETPDFFAGVDERDGEQDVGTDIDPEIGTENSIDPDSVIALYVLAPANSTLSGNQIYTALTSLGFKLGDMDIFHHYGLGQLKSDRPLFSLANMYEPGSFEVKAMDEMSTRGLSIFVCLPAQHNAEDVFDFMLEITRRLAKKLDALVLGPDRKELTRKSLDDIAVQLKQHER